MPEQQGYSLKPVQKDQAEQVPQQPKETKPFIKSEIKFKIPLKSTYDFKVGETAK